MIDEIGRIKKIQNHIITNAGPSITNRAMTAKLHVSPDGNSYDGSTWENAFQTIQEALDAASTDANDLTLIIVAPHATFYDIYTTGDPTWTGNYEIIGSHRLWAPVRNTHGTATSIMKFTEGSVKRLYRNILHTRYPANPHTLFIKSYRGGQCYDRRRKKI